MNSFTYKDIYIENGKKVLEMNVLPEKFCNFDCVFCPIGKSKNKVDSQRSFGDVENALVDLKERIERERPDLVFINSKGEAFINDRIGQIVDFIKVQGPSVRLLSNGYLFGKEEYAEIAHRCDEVIGELKAIREEDFQKLQRPIDGYSLSGYISNMESFRARFKGKFIFEVTIIKGFNDDDISVEETVDVIRRIAPSDLIVVGIDYEPFSKKLEVDPDRLKEISKRLQSAL